MGARAIGTVTAPGLSHRRFLREAQSASVLNHPNICTIYDIGEQGGRPYLVMELLRGETLREALRRGPLSATEVVTYSRQAAAALATAHAQGIVHRDIKPANIFVNEGTRGPKQIKILDFGLAKQQGGDLQESSQAATFGGLATSAGTGTVPGDLTSPGSTLGTVAYMSPEQAKGEPLDARTDLFSLGVVIYEMATGAKPFAGQSTAEVFAALLTRDPAPVSTVNPAMPAELDGIVARLLAKEKEQRYQTAEELLQDLEAFDAQASHRVQREGDGSGEWNACCGAGRCTSCGAGCAERGNKRGPPDAAAGGRGADRAAAGWSIRVVEVPGRRYSGNGDSSCNRTVPGRGGEERHHCGRLCEQHRRPGL